MMRDISPFRPGHRVAALVVVAFVVGLGWGVARTTAQPGTRTFTGEAGMVISHVKAGQATAFERTMTRVGEALALSEEFDRVTGELCPMLAANDRAGMARLLHQWEAYTVEKLKIGHIYEPTPFPLELMPLDEGPTR